MSKSSNSDDPKIQVRCDPTTKKAFKVLCVNEGTTMQEDLLSYVEKRLNDEPTSIRI